jgi:hypothetical protein
VPAGVQVGIEVAAEDLRVNGIVRAGLLALALAGDRVMPLEHEVLAVREELDPDDDPLLWHEVASYNATVKKKAAGPVRGDRASRACCLLRPALL